MSKFNYELAIEEMGGYVIAEFDKTLLCSYLGFSLRVIRKYFEKVGFLLTRISELAKMQKIILNII